MGDKMDRDNYFILLELPLDPPVSDPARIRAAINRKKQEWTRWQDHTDKRTMALVYLAYLPDMEQVLFDPDARKEEARQGQNVLSEMMRRFEAELRILEGKGHLLPREVTAIAAKYKVYGADQQKVYELAKVPVSDNPPGQEISTQPGQALDRHTAKIVERDLAIVGKEDIYAFLGEPPNSSLKKLRAAAEECRLEAAGQKTAESAATEELADICLRLFETLKAKQTYDRYLKVSQFPQLGKMIDEEFNRQKYIGNEALLRLVNYGVESYGCNVLEAQEHIRRYCDAYLIPLGSQAPMIRCPACKEQIENESVVCQYCAAPIKGDCPNCAMPFDEGPASCSTCRFLIGDMVKALPHLEKARGAIIDGNWSTAKRSLEYVAKYWPSHSELEQLEKRSQMLEDRYEDYVRQLSDCVEKNQYYAALELIYEAQEKNVKLPTVTVRRVKRAIKDLETQLDKILAEGNPDVELLLHLSATVNDSIELTRMLAQHPPAAPGSIRAETQGRHVHLNWESSDCPGMIRYLMVRKQEATPFTPFDGDVIYNGPACSFIDQGASPLVNYHYKVYAHRGGTYSKEGTLSRLVMVAPEIENLRIFPADQGAQLTWDFNPDIKQVLIWRKLGGERPSRPDDGMLLETERIDGFVDAKIKNDVDYWYYLSAVYIVDGKRVVSRGVSEMITPRKILAPIEHLSIVKSDYENEYVVNWSGMDSTNLILLTGDKMPAIKVGEMFTVQDLMAQYKSIPLHARGADSGRFRHKFNGGIYVFAAVVMGKYAMVGMPQYLTNFKDVEDLCAELIDGDLRLTMKWPAGINEIAVTYKNKDYPADVDELGINITKITREQYDYDGGVVLQKIAPGNYYLTVFALYPAHGGEYAASEGARLLFRHQPRQEIFYRIIYKKKPFKKQADLSLSISGPSSFIMPVVELVCKLGSLPLHIKDGASMALLDQSPRVKGEVEFQYQIDPLPPGAHLRVFLANERQSKNFRLLPSTELKIT